jgi:hypothetical protein
MTELRQKMIRVTGTATPTTPAGRIMIVETPHGSHFST